MISNDPCVQGGTEGSPNSQTGPFSPTRQGNSLGKNSQGGSFGASHGGSFGQGGASSGKNSQGASFGKNQGGSFGKNSGGQDLMPLASLLSRRTSNAPNSPENQVNSSTAFSGLSPLASPSSQPTGRVSIWALRAPNNASYDSASIGLIDRFYSNG